MNITERESLLLERLKAGDTEALGALLTLHRERLGRMLTVRLDPRLANRISPDDVIQEAAIDVVERIHEYLADPTVPFYVWLRFLTVQRMQMIHRAHLASQMRSASREVSVSDWEFSHASPDSIAGQLVGHLTSPSQAAIRRELQEQLHAVLKTMDTLDREVLALRHFEELSNAEVAAVLGISKEAAGKRHVRALMRLQAILEKAED